MSGKPARAVRKPTATPAVAELEARVAALAAELREAREQQAAAAEILQIINSSQGDLAPVFDAILQRAHDLCGATLGALGLFEDESWRAVATHGYPESLAATLRQASRATDNPLIRPLAEGARRAQFPNVARLHHPIGHAAAKAGIRTVLVVPLRKGAALLGTISASRREVRPFSEEEIALLENFAAQAAVAIENAHLLTEAREALERQTATAEVLQAINSSPGDLAPVFDSILEKAHTLCGATRGTLFFYDGDKFRAAAAHGYPEELLERLRQGIDPRCDTTAFTPITEGARLVHHPDLSQLDDPLARAVSGPGGVRTNLLLPLRKDGVLLGMISCNRAEVRPFSDKEIALLENFAAQAVIAMENARLLGELRESLEHQRAIAELVQTINSSPGNLQPVFDAMVEKAVQLTGAANGLLRTFDGELLHLAAAYGEPKSIEQARQLGPVAARRGQLLGRILDGERVVHVPDVRETDLYRNDPMARERLDLWNTRSWLTVALRKE
ncbi:MAG TPA: GAF domain-containing protein, partial [Stellaceae bacterium]|nr:GAF domain-containing protein [Stellaceae bacterium]